MKQEEKFLGLNAAEVKERIQAGQQNNYEENVAKSTQDIIKDNVLTLFNFLNLAIALCLAAVGAFSNLFFMVIIIINCVIGIVQEIQARNLVAKLSLVNKEKATVIRAGEAQKIETTALVLDDLVVLKAGQQVPSDIEVVAGFVEANEALLTGESDLIEKKPGMLLLSGSFISSGECHGRVVHVGLDNYATKIANEAKIHKPIQSELLGAIRKVSKFTSKVIIPLGILLFLEALFWRQDSLKHSVVASAAALLGMLPKGLALLISLALATAVIKLAKKRILVQEMYAVETLAHVDVVCLDKTGTITEGKMKVAEVVLLGTTGTHEFQKIIGSYLYHSTDQNITMQALRNHFEAENAYAADEILAFSSERKWGSLFLEGVGTVVLGAPEKLFTESQMPPEVLAAQAKGYRVLMLGLNRQQRVTSGQLPSLSPVALFQIDDPIRQNANQTLAYLKAEGVDLKVISGDNPITVSQIAKRAGLTGYEKYIDLSQVTDEGSVRKAASQYTVFGRVSPKQKQILVQALKAQGKTVAMTGDGVNDVLALREADCSIAMAEGDSATRQIANIVLMDSDFTTLPEVLFEGRRVVNNVTKVASIFFIKTIYSFILSLLCLVSGVAFPFLPIQITLIDLAIEGYPSFFLQFESNKKQISGAFLPVVLKRALPNALLVIANLVFVHFYSQSQNFSDLQRTTLMYYLLIFVSLLAVIRACLPLNPLRAFLAVTTFGGIYVAAMLFYRILEVAWLDAQTLPVFGILAVVTVLLYGIYLFVEKKRQPKAG